MVRRMILTSFCEPHPALVYCVLLILTLSLPIPSPISRLLDCESPSEQVSVSEISPSAARPWALSIRCSVIP